MLLSSIRYPLTIPQAQGNATWLLTNLTAAIFDDAALMQRKFIL
jgi:hypothetical protein